MEGQEMGYPSEDGMDSMEISPSPTLHSHGPNSPSLAANTTTENVTDVDSMADNIFSNDAGPTSVKAEMLEIWPFSTPHSHGPNFPHLAPNTLIENEMDSMKDDVYSNDAGLASGEAEMLHALDGMTMDDPPLERPLTSWADN
jgi:hypothetical protein